MTKSELIAKLAARYPQLVAKDAELAVKMILDAMAKTWPKGSASRSEASEAWTELSAPAHRTQSQVRRESASAGRSMFRISKPARN